MDAFSAVGVEVISKDADDPTITEAENRGYNPDTQVFNNRIAMTWEEAEILAKRLTKSYNSSSVTDYGYYTEWWFNYVWSIGGDVLTYENGEYRFSLGDTTPQGEGLPSSREAFEYFVSLSNALNISPKPNTISTVGKTNYFTTGKVAMMVDGRWSTVSIRRDASFDWDVAPLPKHENGELAGHSGSMGFGIWKRSNRASEAFKFMEFLAGPVGQAAQAETGFNVPNQRDLAYSDVFLQPTLKPQNARAFLDAAEYQRGGDWSYLPDSAWISVWAPTLNGAVLNGQMTVTAFFNQYTEATNTLLRTYTN